MNISQEVHKFLISLKNNCSSNFSDVDVGRNGKFCEQVFEGWFCWPSTKAGVLAVQPCTNEILISTKKNGVVTKLCSENGTWYSSGYNITDCGKLFVIQSPPQYYEEMDPIYSKWIPNIKLVSYFGYSLSILSLAIALFVFIKIKRLHCERNKLHIHLFTSFMLRACTFLLKDILFVNGTALLNETYNENGEIHFTYSWVCKAFITIRNYCVMANFMFMLMEGVYLHNLMFLNLFSDNHTTNIYCIVGWGIPVIFTVLWVILRTFYENTECWTRKEDLSVAHFLLELPIAFTIAVNFILFVVIVRVLITKLNINMEHIQQRKLKYSKLLKSTLILIPLFGIPYTISLLLYLHIHQSVILELLWLFFDQSFSAFQGFFAALVYCLLNGEVKTEIKRKYFLLKDRRNKKFSRSRTISCNTQQFSLQASDDTLDNIQIFGIEENSSKKNTETYF